MAKPTSLAELVPYLHEAPRVRVTGLDGRVGVEEFRHAEPSGLWFSKQSAKLHFLPVNCRRGAAAAFESGVTFDESGFSVTKFGRTIRVEYLGS